MVSLLKTPCDVIGLLEDDPARHAFHLSLTEDPYKDFTVWSVSRDDSGDVRAAVALYFRSDPCALLTAGSTEGLEEIFSQLVFLPDGVFSAIPSDHAPALCGRYRWRQERTMLRMRLDVSAYAESEATEHAQVRQLTEDDLPKLSSLYRHAERFCVDAYQLLSGNYYGVFDGDDIVSSAAVHCLSIEHSVAVIGNVVTHPSHRRKGLAAECVAAVIDHLLPAIDNIVLTVDERNRPARALYEKMGFVEDSRFLEGCGRLFRPAGKMIPPSRLRRSVPALASG